MNAPEYFLECMSQCVTCPPELKNHARRTAGAPLVGPLSYNPKPHDNPNSNCHFNSNHNITSTVTRWVQLPLLIRHGNQNRARINAQCQVSNPDPHLNPCPHLCHRPRGLRGSSEADRLTWSGNRRNLAHKLQGLVKRWLSALKFPDKIKDPNKPLNFTTLENVFKKIHPKFTQKLKDKQYACCYEELAQFRIQIEAQDAADKGKKRSRGS